MVCDFLPGIARLPCHPDRTCPVIHVLDCLLYLNRTIQIRHRLQIMGLWQPLKIAAQRKILDRLVSAEGFPDSLSWKRAGAQRRRERGSGLTTPPGDGARGLTPGRKPAGPLR